MSAQPESLTPAPQAAPLLGGIAIIIACGVLAPFVGLKGILLGLAAACGLAALVWWRPALWFGLIFTLPFSMEIEGLLGPADLTLPSEALIPALLMAQLAAFIIIGRISYVRSPLNAPVLAFATIMVATLLISGDRIVTFKALARDLSSLLAGYYLAMLYVRDRRGVVILLWGIGLSLALAATWGMYTQLRDGIRIYSNIGGPIYTDHCIYAAHLSIAMAGLFALLVDRPRGVAWRLPAWGVLGVLTLAVGLSFVRGAWLSLLGAAVLVVVVRWWRLRPGLILGGGLVAFVMLMLVGALGVAELFSYRLEHAFQATYVTNFDRVDRWMTAIHMWSDHPLLGVGYGRYPDVYPGYIFFLDAYSTEIRMGAHNLYLELLAEVGLIGFVVYLWLLATAMLQARRLWRHARDPFHAAMGLALGAALVTLLIHFVVNNLGPSDKIAIMFWLILGLLAVVARMDREAPETSGDECSDSR